MDNQLNGSPVKFFNAGKSKSRLILRALAAVILLAAAFVIWTYLSGRSALQDAIAQTNAIDTRWKLEELLSDRKSIPDEENSALVIIKGYVLENRTNQSELIDADVQGLEFVWDQDAFSLSEKRKTALGLLIKSHERSMPVYRQIANMPNGRYPFAGVMVSSTSQFPVTYAREANRALRFGFLDQLERGNNLSACQDIHAMIRVVSSLGDEPLRTTIQIRNALRYSATYAVRRLLAQVELDDPPLAQIQQLLEEEKDISLAKQYVRCERAMGLEFLGNNIATQQPTTRIRMAGNYVREKLNQIGYYQLQTARYIVTQNRILEILDGPNTGQLRALILLDDSLDASSPIRPFLHSTIQQIIVGYFKSHAELECTITALAAERFRIRNQRWPATLTELIEQGFLKSVPIDPYDGNPLRWKATENGRVVYSIGRDSTDDGGAYSRINPSDPGNDIVFRLYDPAHRRLPPLTEIAQPQKP